MTILVLSYQLSPTRGSEYSVGWNYVKEMSKYHRLLVVVGAAGDYMGDFGEISTIELDNNYNSYFIPVKPNLFASSFNYLNKLGLTYFFYLAYKIWHLQVLKVSKRLIKTEKVDLVHFLNPIGFREPGFLWKLGLPYMWGPISGAAMRPTCLFKSLSVKSRTQFYIRNIITFIQFKYSVSLRRAIANTDLLLTATSENQNLFKVYHNKDSFLMPENGVVADNETNRTIFLDNSDIVNLLFVGTIDANKSLIILLKALSLVCAQNWHLNVVGDGPLFKSMRSLSVFLHLESKITWFGKIPRASVFEIIQKSHLNIITSLGEGNPTTIWEAMTYGVPSITLDHCGMHDVICDNCGIRIKILSYDQVIKDLSDNLSTLLSNPKLINEFSLGVNICRNKYNWAHRVELFNHYYNLTIENWQKTHT